MGKRSTSGGKKLVVTKTKVKTLTEKETATVVGGQAEGIPRYTALCGNCG